MNKRKVIDYMSAFSTILELSQTNDIEIKFHENHVTIYQLTLLSNAFDIATVYLLEDKFCLYFDVLIPEVEHQRYLNMTTQLREFEKHKDVDLTLFNAKSHTNYQYVTKNTDVLLDMLGIITTEIMAQHNDDMVI